MINPRDTIRVIVIVDPVGSALGTPNEEIAGIMRDLRDFCDDMNFELVAGLTGTYAIDDKRADLLIVDYGGMSCAGASDTCVWEMRFATEWAQNHPGCLMVVWSSFSRRLYERELSEEFGHLDNVIWRCEGDTDQFDAIRQWFGDPLKGCDGSTKVA